MDGTARLGDGDRLFRRLRFGRLAELSMLDLRTYRRRAGRDARSPPAPGPTAEVSDPDAHHHRRRSSCDWLKDSLRPDRRRSGR